jgi:tetratricopeptide (TPR) repeat protein
VYAATNAKFEQAYTTIAEKLNIPRRDDPKTNKMDLVRDWLNDKSHGRWLMILDNADNRSLYFPPIDSNTTYESNVQPYLADYLPWSSSEHGSLVITSRNKKLGSDLADGHDAIDVQPFEPAEAQLLLKSKMLEGYWSMAEAKDLLEVLGFIPLAITQAAAYMRVNWISMEKYLKALSQSDSNLGEHLSIELLDPRRQRDTPSSVFLTWKLSFDQVSMEEPRAAEMLSLMAFLDEQGIPEVLLRRNEELDVRDTNAIGTLLAFSLITAETNDETYSMHRLVQLSTQTWLSLQNSKGTWERNALELLSKEFPNGEHENKTKCNTLLPHAMAVLKYRPASGSDLLCRASLLYNLGWYDLRQGRYKQATKYCEESYAERQRILGLDDPNTLNSLGLLATTFWNQGRWKEAEELEVQVKDTRKRVLGAEHPNTLTSMANLASTYRSQGRWKEAEELQAQELEICFKVLGEEHPDTLISMENLAVIWRGIGRDMEALQLLQKCVRLRKQILGGDHPYTISSSARLIKWQTAKSDV